LPGLPERYVAVKFYAGPATSDTPGTRAMLRERIAMLAASRPVVLLDTGLAVDDHADYLFADLPNVINARGWMTPRTNLGVQAALVANAELFVSTCGGLAWLAPLMGVPTVGVYEDDRFLAPHLFVARQVYRRVGAAEFTTLDLRAAARFTVVTP
jgi:ADP-heptose:LPS heptosyltransferase